METAPVRSLFFLLLASVSVFAGPFTSVAVTSATCGASDAGTTFASASYFGGPCNGYLAEPGSGTGSSQFGSFMASASSTHFYSVSAVTSIAGESRWVMVDGAGTGSVIFSVATFGTSTNDDTVQAHVDLTVNGISQDLILTSPCGDFGKTAACNGTLTSNPFAIPYGVPFLMTFALTAEAWGDASINVSATYGVTSGQTVADIPEPGTAVLFGFAISALFLASLFLRSFR